MIYMVLADGAFRNIWFKKTNTLLAIIASVFSVASIIYINTGVRASTAKAQEIIQGYEKRLIETGEISKYQENDS